MSVITNPKFDLFQAERKYSDLLKDVFFAGEIILSEEELTSLCSLICANYGRVKNNDCNNALLIAVVNIAYFYYDDDGFWCHFNDICRLILHDINNDSIGRRIENTLRINDLLHHERKGPFRYVGAILEQTGITKRNIPRFAQIIKNAEYQFGLRKLAEISYSDYSRFIEFQYCPKFFKQYLLDESGWNFTKQVSGILYYVKNEGLNIEDLATIRGFHPDFWKMFFSNYSMPKVKIKSNQHNNFVTPGLFFDIKAMKIFLKLPSTQYSLDNYYEHNIVDKFKIELRCKEDFRSSFTGKYMSTTGEEIHWSIMGWDITRDEVAYFHAYYGYIKSEENIVPGRYYVISKQSDEIPGQIIHTYEKSFVVGAEEYNVFEVNIHSLQHTIEKKSERVTIEWTRQSDLPMVNSFYNIYFDQVPTIKIENEHLLDNGKAMIFYDIGDGIKRLKDYKNLTDLKKEYEGRSILKGYLWTESLIRSNFGRNDSERRLLTFSILPRFEPDFPLSLYSIDDEIRFGCESKNIKFLNLKKDNLRNEWIIPPSLNLLQGLIFDKQSQTEFTMPIERADILLLSNLKRRFINITEEDSSEYLTFLGIPNEKFIPAIKIYKGMIAMLKEATFNDSGEYRVSIDSVQQFCNSENICVGEFIYSCKGKNYELRKGIFNIPFDAISFDYLRLLKENNQIIKNIAPEIMERIDQISDILKEHHDSLQYSLERTTIKGIDNFYDTVIGMAYYLDYTSILNHDAIKIKIDEEYIKIDKFREVYRWYICINKALKDVDIATLQNLISEYPKLDQTCLAERWVQKLECAYKLAGRAVNPTDVLSEWCNEISDYKLFRYKNDISLSEGGKFLSHAWVYYLKGNYDKALVLLKKSEGNIHPIALRLKVFLLCIIYLKFGRFTALEEVIENYSYGTKEIDALIDCYKIAFEVIVLRKNQRKSKFVSKAAIDIPLKEDDKIILNFLSSTFYNNAELLIKTAMESDSWFIILFTLKYLENANISNKELKQRLKAQEKKIPKFPQWEEFIEELMIDK